MNAEDPATPPAWAYVAQHRTLLSRFSHGTRFRPRHADIGDYHHDLLLAVVDSFERFKPPEAASVCSECNGRGCSTWLGWQARAVATTHNRSRARRLNEEPEDGLLDTPSTYGTPRDMVTSARVNEVLARATDSEREAAFTILDGLDAAGVRERLGVSRPARDFRLRRLAQRLDKEKADAEGIKPNRSV